MSAEAKDNALNGIFIVGIVNARTQRKYKNGEEHFFLHIVVAPIVRTDFYLFKVKTLPVVRLPAQPLVAS